MCLHQSAPPRRPPIGGTANGMGNFEINTRDCFKHFLLDGCATFIIIIILLIKHYS